MSCSPFWLDDPRILIDEAKEFFPFTEHDQRCTASALNSFTRFGLYLGVLLSLVRLEAAWLLVGLAFAGFAVGAWFFMKANGSVNESEGFSSYIMGALANAFTSGKSEGFRAEGISRVFDTEAPILDPRDVINEYVPDVIGIPKAERTFPTAANPFMNVLLTEIGDNPYRSPAANVQGEVVKEELDSYFQTMFARDPGDVFNHTQNQRNWVAMPNTTIPNDQGAFANWLYRVPGQTCKEGNMAQCNFNTGAEALPWREIRKLT